MLWIGFALIVIGLLVAVAGRRGMRFGAFTGNFANRVRGDVDQTYIEANADAAPAASVKGDRFVKWAGLVIAFGGIVVAIVELFAG